MINLLENGEVLISYRYNHGMALSHVKPQKLPRRLYPESQNEVLDDRDTLDGH